MKRIFIVFLAIISILSATVYLLSCLTCFIGANFWWPLGFIGLGFPLIFAGMILLFVTWVLINRKIALLLLICILLGFNNIASVFALRFNPKTFILHKQPNAIRIMGYNVRGFVTVDKNLPQTTCRDEMFNYIIEQNPDILCLQDFIEYHNYNIPFFSNIAYLQDKAYLKYYYIGAGNDVERWGVAQNGVAIFSKYPLKNIQNITYTGEVLPESIITADVTINNITKRILVTHLQSMWLFAQTNGATKNQSEDTVLKYNKSVFNKLNSHFAYHAQQADELKKEIDKSPYPVILSLDMNEVPSSYCYHHVRGKLNDAFLQQGSGLGRTYYRISPTLRIDYLMTDPSIKIIQYKKDNIFMSDHYPQVMDVKW